MMVYEPSDYDSEDSSAEYIDFEAEQELFNLINPRAPATSPSTSAANPSTNPRSQNEDKDEYVPFKLFDENGNRNWIKFYDSDDESECGFETDKASDEDSINSEGLEVPDLIEYDSEIDSDSDDDEDTKLKHVPKKYTCNNHCGRMRVCQSPHE